MFITECIYESWPLNETYDEIWILNNDTVCSTLPCYYVSKEIVAL